MREDTENGRADCARAHDGVAGEAHAAGDAERVDLGAVFAAMPGIDLVLAPDAPRYTMLAATDGRLRATMTTREATLGRGHFEVFPDANPADDARSGEGNLRASLDTVLRTRAPHRMAVQRYDIRRPDGTWEERHWAPLNVPVLGADGAVRYVIHRVEDVTEAVRLAAEGDRLRGAHGESERARTAAEAARDEVAAANAQLLEQALELELANQQLQDQAAELELQAEELQATAAQLEEQVEAAEHAAAALRASEGQLRTLADAIPTLAWTAKPDGHIDWYNARWYEYTGTTPEQMAGWGWQSVHDAAELPWVLERWRAGIASGEPVEMTFPLKGADGRFRRFLTRIVPLRDADGRVVRWFGTNTDVEAERRARDAAEAARAEAVAASRAKSDFLAVMSHELRTPLNAIGGYAQLMELGLHGPVTPEQLAALDRIQRGQRHLLGLINAVLNYAKLEAGHVAYATADVPVGPALAEVAALLAPQAQAKGLALGVAPCDPELRACADPEKVRQVLLNLLSNAVKFTRGGGTLTLGGERAPDGRVALRVADTGRGIPADQLERVFQPFVQVDASLTRAQEGTGLGLAISRDLARGMGGDLTVESTPGVGSTFTLTLPRA